MNINCTPQALRRAADIAEKIQSLQAELANLLSGTGERRPSGTGKTLDERCRALPHCRRGTSPVGKVSSGQRRRTNHAQKEAAHERSSSGALGGNCQGAVAGGEGGEKHGALIGGCAKRGWLMAGYFSVIVRRQFHQQVKCRYPHT